ncbi:hypothetical protein RBSWK_06520 [Rhodopirellula baltica SWK14]|uniref:Uncharacterized protein n=1 Tax=Rhodopirellula baltica SWK14 TaxID=993516 RepID=L7C7A1_RHOBT|nr:hypothetical protein RBSWK_06520 [Rhodopirellula baltica SWK14]
MSQDVGRTGKTDQWMHWKNEWLHCHKRPSIDAEAAQSGSAVI